MKRLLLALVLLAAPLALAQTSLDELNQAIKQAAELRQQRLEEAREAQAKLKTLGKEVQRKLRELDGITQDITRLENEKMELTKTINGLEEQIDATEKEIAQLEDRLGRLKSRMTKLVEKLYRERAGRYLPLLRAESFTDLLMRAGWIQYLGASDVKLVETLTSLVRELQAARERLLNLSAELSRKKADREERIAALEKKKARYQQVLAELKKEQASEEVRVVELNKAAEQLEKQMAELAAQLEAEKKRLEEERRRREAEARASGRIPTFDVPRELVGKLLFPVPGGRIVAPFGTNNNTWQVIAAGEDYAPVRAAASGQVYAVAYYANYGWTVIILHSDNLLTRYVNLQEPLVHTGDIVEQGQIIGYLGGSAMIPPNEMWFSVLLSKGKQLVSVDPAKYY
ncbi:murein hydrolase activator EnvC family protein [Oceanithermus sp.]